MVDVPGFLGTGPTWIATPTGNADITTTGVGFPLNITYDVTTADLFDLSFSFHGPVVGPQVVSFAEPINEIVGNDLRGPVNITIENDSPLPIAGDPIHSNPAFQIVAQRDVPTGNPDPAAMFHADYAHFHAAGGAPIPQTLFSGFSNLGLFTLDGTPAPTNPGVIQANFGTIAPGGSSTANIATLHDVQHTGVNDAFKVGFFPQFTGEAVALKEALSGTTVIHAEGSDFEFTALRTGGWSELERPLDVDWQVTGSGTHPADASDFVGGVLPHGTIHFPANDTLSAVAGALSQTIIIPVLGDTIVEGDETFTLSLTPVNPTGISVVATSASAAGLIQDTPVPTPSDDDEHDRADKHEHDRADKHERGRDEADHDLPLKEHAEHHHDEDGSDHRGVDIDFHHCVPHATDSHSDWHWAS
jgi:hypothetical protein